MPIIGDLYKQIGRLTAGAVSIAAAYDAKSDQIVGLTVSSFVTLSFDPPMIMFALQHNADSYASIVSSRAFGISVLASNQSQIAALFARKGREKSECTALTHGQKLHVPLIAGALANLECLTSQIILSGDHAIVVGIVDAAATETGAPLLYFAGQYGTYTPI
jgi:flavin reductase (DIM6/NTAB) family NADH-FMN oxidoreductase RutF